MLAPSTTPVPQRRFLLPRRHRRRLACAAVAASTALGILGVGATAETVRHQPRTEAVQAAR